MTHDKVNRLILIILMGLSALYFVVTLCHTDFFDLSGHDAIEGRIK